MKISQEVIDYIEDNGFKVEECTEKEIKEAKKEVEAIKDGYVILDGVFTKKRMFVNID